MKKLKALICTATALVLCAGLFAGCAGGKEYELSSYRGEQTDEKGEIVYNKSLFYNNSVHQGGADPQVLDDTARSGYYYLFTTAGSFHTMRSKNLTEWENVGPTFYQRQHQDNPEEVRKATASCMWAPEVIYDKETELYYMFFSATPESDYNYMTYKLDDNGNKVYTGDKSGEGLVNNCHLYNMYVATSDKAAGPYKLINFGDEANCHKFQVAGENGTKIEKGRVHQGWNTETGHELSQPEVDSGNYAYTLQNGKYYEAAFPHYYAKYCLFAPDELYKFNVKMGVGEEEGKIWGSGYYGNIDPHPYVDPVTGEKYLYCNMSRPTGIMVIHMFDWYTPDWDNAEIVAIDQYYTVEQWKEDRATGSTEHKGVSYETTSCNEGPHVIYHESATQEKGKGTYYLTFSVNNYENSNYRVATAIADSPMGPFRKLTAAEGALVLCSGSTESDTISGAGHHSFVTMGDQLFIVYHRHTSFEVGGNSRYTAVDELKWIDVKDKDGKPLTVPYTNGPTDSIQPQPAAYSGYKNVAEGMTVTTDNDEVEDLGCLNDGLLSVHKSADTTFMSYIRETLITKTTTFTFDFEEARNVRAVMVYNSADYTQIFYNISKMEFVLADGSVRVIRDTKFDVDRYCKKSEYSGEVEDIRSGVAAFAEFYDIDVKSVKITVDVPEGQDFVGISEIRILGKA